MPSERAAKKPKKPKKTKEYKPVGIAEIDALRDLAPCQLSDYLLAVSTYIRVQSTLTDSIKKRAQIQLSRGLGYALVYDLLQKLPQIEKTVVVGETKVAGGLRSTNADVSEMHKLDGLRFAVELKPVNLAVGRAIWNRFGDLRTFAVNLHLKFPFAVVGGVLVIPTVEEKGTKAATAAEADEQAVADMGDSTEVKVLTSDTETESGNNAASNEEATAESASAPATPATTDVTHPAPPALQPNFVSTTHLITRAAARLVRAGGRKSEADAAHLLEGIAVVAFDPFTAQLDEQLPAPTSRLRWDEFIDDLAKAYAGRFEK